MTHTLFLLLSLQDLLLFQDSMKAAVALLHVQVSFSYTLPAPAHQGIVTMKLQGFSPAATRRGTAQPVGIEQLNLGIQGGQNTISLGYCA